MNFSLSLETPIWNWNPSPPLALTELLALYLHSYHQFHPLHHPLCAQPLTNPKIKSNLQVTQCLFPQLSTLFLTNLTPFHRVTLNLKTNRDSLLHQDETFNHSSYTPDTSDPNPTLIPRHFIDNISVNISLPRQEPSRGLDSVAASIMNSNPSFHRGI